MSWEMAFNILVSLSKPHVESNQHNKNHLKLITRPLKMNHLKIKTLFEFIDVHCPNLQRSLVVIPQPLV
jgi:hypothetical protein